MPVSQSMYQVRLEWGAAGLARLAPADLVVLIDVFGAYPRVETGADAAAHGVGIAALPAPAADVVASADAPVALGGLRNAAAVARWIMAQQTARGERTSIAIIALDAAGRYAVENALGAGAVIAALGDLGIDHCSPDAAVAGEGFRALRGAVRHLLTASDSGLDLAAAGRRDEVLAAAALDAASTVPVLRAGLFVAE